LRRLLAGYDPGAFLNPRHALYRKMRLKENPPSPAEIIRLMAEEPNLIKRPLVVREGRAVAGYDEMGLARLLR
jgi:arsenate reductase-like glutaredoxin family protein